MITLEIKNIASVEAAQYLKLPYDQFINYVYRGLISYQLKGKEKFYSRVDLDRFTKEVLNR